MLYIDFDGVILDTEELLFEEWRKNSDRFSLPESEKIKYIQEANWDFILNNSEIINDSVYYLKNMDVKDTRILTKVHSLENEANSKIKWIREMGIEHPILIVPYNVKKADVVDARENILVDDCLKNLDEWVEKGGYPIFFDMNNDNCDSWQQPNVKCYEKVLSLKKLTKSY